MPFANEKKTPLPPLLVKLEQWFQPFLVQVPVKLFCGQLSR
jgi:hypothetical protein